MYCVSKVIAGLQILVLCTIVKFQKQGRRELSFMVDEMWLALESVLLCRGSDRCVVRLDDGCVCYVMVNAAGYIHKVEFSFHCT
mmetsp:Transcript_23712/g.50042  ORF Transcript_23712/g.50042 Transcript_23712/m.50042 type:complete len:84 (+) Transcript_23712:117-368(+)